MQRVLRAAVIAVVVGALTVATPAPVMNAGPTNQRVVSANSGSLDTAAAEQEFEDMINQLRIDRGVPPLEVDQTLITLARERSTDMIARNYFSHEIPGVGFGPQWLLDQLPLAFGTGENLGLSDEPNQEVIGTLFKAWVASPSHLQNMLRPEFNRIGVGVVESPSPNPGASVKMVTQVYAVADGPLARG